MEKKSFKAGEGIFISQEEALKMMNKAFAADIPKLYCNGFVNALGVNDVTLVLQQNHHNVATVNLSLITAKTLAIKLTELVQKFEGATGSTVPTSDEVASSLGVPLNK